MVCLKNLYKETGLVPEWMRMKRFMTAAVATLMIATMFISCATGSGSNASEAVEDVEIISVEPEVVEVQEEPVEEAAEEEKGGWLTAMGSIDGLDVKGFRLRGEGPDGASFGWVDVKGTKVALSDIRRGEWDLYAEAIGANGEVVATGHLKTFLSDSTPLGTLFLSEEVGTGDVVCDFGWTTTQVLYPSIEVYVKTEDGEFMSRDVREISIDENGHAVWKAKDMPAGSYIVRALLKDEGEIVSGVAAALRVVDGKTSIGNCRFIVGKLSTVYGIDLQNSPIDTVQGSIALEEGSLTFVSDIEDLRYAWFLDGSIMSDFRNMKTIDLGSLELKKGFYRFDCIASNPAGFSSINTETVFIYSDGAGNVSAVTEDQADSRKGDVPEGYTEVATKDSPEYSAGLAFQVGDYEPVMTAPVQEAVAETEPAVVEAPVVEAEVVAEPEVVVEAVVVAEPEAMDNADDEVVTVENVEYPPVADEAASADVMEDPIVIDLGAFAPVGAEEDIIVY